MASLTQGEFKISINDALDTFRNSLLALIPSADRARLTWKDLNPHDDWEKVAEVLFEVFVSHPAMLDAPAQKRQMLRLPRYDYDLDSYSSHSWIEVAAPSLEGPHVLIRLLSHDFPFDTVQVARIDNETQARLGPVSISWNDASFFLRRRFWDGSSDLVVEVTPIE